MRVSGLNFDLRRLAAPVPMWFAGIALADWLRASHTVRDAGGRLLALWGGPQDALASVCAAYATLEGLLWLELPLAPGQTSYPDVAPIFTVASRMQRAAADLSGI